MNKLVLTVVLSFLVTFNWSFAQEKPNIILIMADDLGFGDVGFNGNTIIKTPNMDKLSTLGLTFSNFYSGGPVCSPTRGTCLTGRHYFRYGVFSANVGHLPKEEITLARLLKEQGYNTGHFGKWHLGTLNPESSSKGEKRKPKENFAPPWLRDYDESFVTETSIATWNPGGGKRYLNNPYYHNGTVETENLEGDDSRVIMDRVVPFIEKSVENKEPFFSVVWFHTPHEPVIAGPEYRKMYSGYSEGEQDFYGCITAMDEQIGRLYEKLKELGINNNTMVWFCSDNGPEGKEVSEKHPGTTGGLRGRKRSLYCGGTGVPAFVVWPPAVKPGTKTNYISGTLDYLPTILDVLNLKMPDNRPIDGVSLLPMIEGKQDVRPEPMPFMHRGKAAWIDGDLKFITAGDKVKEVYNLRTDRAEEHNLYDQYPEKVADINDHIMKWNLSCKKSHSGDDYKEGFSPVDSWEGIDMKKESKNDSQ